MKKFLVILPVIFSVLGTVSCGPDFFVQKWEAGKAELSHAQIVQIAGPNKHIKTPCIIEINCPNEIISEYKSTNFSYPLSQVFENILNGARDKILEPPQYGTNSFKLVVDVQEATLSVSTNVFNNGGTAKFYMCIICRFYDPTEKRIFGTNISVEKVLPINQKKSDYVFDAVYEGCKDCSVIILKNILKDNRTVNALKRYEK